LDGEMELIAGVGLFCEAVEGSVLPLANGLEPPPEQPEIAPSTINGIETRRKRRRQPCAGRAGLTLRLLQRAGDN
jgi:hypothetical protein